LPVKFGEWRFADELDWLLPAIALTVCLAAFTLIEIPTYSGIVPALMLLPLWMLAASALAGMIAALSVLRMMRAGVERPLAKSAAFLARNWRLLLFVACGTALAGLNMVTFMWVKPLLNYLIPFRADPLLASIDHFIFGTDPWRLLTFLNVTPLAIFYHRVWFGLMIITLLMVLMKPSSAEKSATLLTYFMLWSLFGPLVHSLLPAAGPVFYEQLGYGNRFAGLVMEPETRQAAGYLWHFYANQSFGGGAGISAMPSLHIATTAWMVIAVGKFAPRWTVPMSAAGALIFLLSVSLGWHYVIDGLVGTAGAFAIWKATLFVLEARTGGLRTVLQLS
jgi:hypothetical protein